MARSRRSREQVDIWPGFVDAISTLLLSIIFLLIVFVLGQFFLGQMLQGRTDPFDMLPDLRYVRMFEAIGCHGEFVTRPEEIRSSLERAFGAGKASLINVIGDPRIGHARLGGNLLGSTQVEG